MLFSTSPCMSASTFQVLPRAYRWPYISPMEGWNVNLVFSIPRKHASNLPHPLLRFWKSQIDIEIIESKFVWKCYPPIQIREPSKDTSKRLEMFFRIFRKSICFRSQLSSLPVSCQDFKKTRKFTCNSSKRKDSGNVTGQKFEHLVTPIYKKIWPMEKWGTDSLEKVKIVGINKNKSSELELFGANWLIIFLWMQRLQRKAKRNSIETLSNGVQTYLFDMCHTHRLKEYCNYLNFNCRVSSWPIWIHFKYSTNIQRSVQLFQPKHA